MKKILKTNNKISKYFLGFPLVLLLALAWIQSDYTVLTADEAPPTVSSVSPADGAVDVPISLSSIIVTFSKEMNWSTFSPSNIYVHDSKDDPVEIGGRGYGTNFAQLSPSAPLEENEVYTVVVKAVVEDLAGNTLDGNKDGVSQGSPGDDYTSTFTTGALPPDTTPPTVSSVSPADGAVDVSIAQTSIVVMFSEEMDWSTFSRYNIYVQDSQALPVETSGFGRGVNFFQINPSAPLKENELYTVVVKAVVTDLSGNTLDGNGNGTAQESPEDDHSSTFTTGILPPDTTPPTVSSVSPADEAVDVPVALSSIVVTFSEDMDWSTFSRTNIYLQDSQEVPIQTSGFGRGMDFFQINPSAPLKLNEIYTVVAKAVVTDLSGNTLDGNENGLEEYPPADNFMSTFTTVSIQKMIEDLIEDIQNLVDAGQLRERDGRKLSKELEKATVKLDNNKDDKAIDKLNKFIDEVNKLIDRGKLSQEDGQSLIDQANAIINQLSN